MSELSEVQAIVNELAAALLARGVVKPEVEYQVRANMEGMIWLSWVKDSAVHDNDRHYSRHKGIPAVAAEAAREAIAAMPDAATRRKTAFLAELDKVIDIGRRNGIEVDFVNPLVETMKRLSENIITHQKAGAQ